LRQVVNLKGYLLSERYDRQNDNGDDYHTDDNGDGVQQKRL